MVIYLDNNATTKMCKTAAEEYIKWLQLYDTNEVDTFIDKAKTIAGRYLGASNYELMFNSGSSESNSTFIEMIVRARKKISPERLHIVSSAIEHKNINLHLDQLTRNGSATVTYVQPNECGVITLESIRRAAKPQTKLIIVMHSNNETGVVNPIQDIVKWARTKGIVVYSDTTQSMGKLPLNMNTLDVDGFTVSFHKLHGPKGVGILAVKRALLTGWKLEGLIHGAQNGGYRGGTYNIPGIASALRSLQVTIENLDENILRMNDLTVKLIDEISKQWKVVSYSDYISPSRPSFNSKVVVVLLTPRLNKGVKLLPNTLLISIVKDKMCNVSLRKKLRENNIFVGIGSACNIKDPLASHVVRAMPGIDDRPEIKKGVIRISVDWTTSNKDIIDFVQCLKSSLP